MGGCVTGWIVDELFALFLVFACDCPAKWPCLVLTCCQ